jgi:hypothetical protein
MGPQQTWGCMHPTGAYAATPSPWTAALDKGMDAPRHIRTQGACAGPAATTQGKHTVHHTSQGKLSASMRYLQPMGTSSKPWQPACRNRRQRLHATHHTLHDTEL